MAPNPPGPTFTFWQLLRLIPHLRDDLLALLTEWKSRYGDTIYTQFVRTHNYNFFHPDDIHAVLVEHAPKLSKTSDYTDPRVGLAKFLGNGLLVSDGEFWRRQRKLVAPSLHAKRVEAYADTMVEFTLKMLDSWQDAAQIDVAGAMTTLTLRIVAKTLFDVDAESDAARISSAVEVLQQSSGSFSLVPAWVPTPGRMAGTRAARDLDDIVYRLIRERRADRRDRGDLLSMLLDAVDEDTDSGMTDKQVRDEAVTLYLAGHETTANTMKWTWYLLSQNPAAEAALHAELDSVLGGRPPTLADLDHLPYTEWVIKEALRLYPPAYGFSRLAKEPLTIGGYDIPAGAFLHVVPYITHRDPRFHANPNAFQPERFANDAEKRWPRYAYFPFGGGPRVCIGNSFALMEARLILATVASRYRLRLPMGYPVYPKALITLVPRDGLRMTAEQRQPVPVA